MNILILIAMVAWTSWVADSKPLQSQNGDHVEILSMIVLETHQDYEVVKIPKSQWVCTSKDGEGDNKQFQRLFMYITGFNRKFQKIAMSAPVETLMEPEGNGYKSTMCFWTGSEWDDKDLPKPISSKVFTMKQKEMAAYVRRFSGYANHQDYINERANLIESVGKKLADTKEYFEVGYDAPWVPAEKRRNEVWIKKIETKLKELKYEVLEKFDGYELREYREQNWICTKMKDIDPSEDPMNGWEKTYWNNPYLAMVFGPWSKQPQNKMFRKLFKYINGDNQEEVKIPMTTPVANGHIMTNKGEEDQTMCFWLNIENPPKPKEGSEVKFITKKGFKVYVRQFGGFAISYDDFHAQYLKLKKQLRQDGIMNFDPKNWEHASYNSPFTMINRRNEVWIHNE